MIFKDIAKYSISGAPGNECFNTKLMLGFEVLCQALRKWQYLEPFTIFYIYNILSSVRYIQRFKKIRITILNVLFPNQ